MNKDEQLRRRPKDSNIKDEQLKANLKNTNKAQPVPELPPPDHTYRRTVRCLVFLLVVLFIMFFICIFLIFIAHSTTTYPVQYSLPDAPSLLNVHDISAYNTSKLLEGDIRGPEYITLRNGLIYTGTADGRVLEVGEEAQSIRVLAKLGKGEDCGSYDSEAQCGRPLGMEFDVDGFLLVVDAYLGIFRLDVQTGLVQTVVTTYSTKTEPHDLKLTFMNDLEVTDNGDIFFTDSSIFTRRDLMQDVLMGAANGRLLKYDPLLNLVTIATSILAFPNGLLLSRFQDYILIAETTRARIIKYNINGINAGATEIWAENLPCLPDNLQYSPRGTIWVGCGHPRHQGVWFSLIDVMGSMVWLRRVLQELPFSAIASLLKPRSLLLELSGESGKVLRTFVDEDAHVLRHVSHVVESLDGKKLYVGSFKADYIGVVEL